MQSNEFNEAAVEAIAETAETIERPRVNPPVIAAPEVSKPLISAASEISSEPVEMTNEIWQQVIQAWEEYFGEGKKSNLTIAITIIATIPILIAASALLDFLNKLPLLPSVFELVGFGYSGWFVYRYLLLANTRKELLDAIAAWKQKVFG